jgi:tetratricopeptide (TPR) repeat protein
MENTKLIELRRVHATELAAGKYSSAEQVCWLALEICGYRGPHRKFSDWLTSVRLREGKMEQEGCLWQWACYLADIYYELGKYSEAEPLYARLAVLWMSLPSELKEQTSETRGLLPDLLRRLAGAEAFIGKERRAKKHWTLAKALSGKRISAQTLDRAAFTAGSFASGRISAGRSFSGRRQSLARYRRFRRS